MNPTPSTLRFMVFAAAFTACTAPSAPPDKPTGAQPLVNTPNSTVAGPAATPNSTVSAPAATPTSGTAPSNSGGNTVPPLSKRPSNLTCLAPPVGPGGTTAFPLKLSETGCFSPTNPKQATQGLIAYDVKTHLWSDGATKRRWLALPDNSKLAINPDGDLELPPGGVLLKEFTLENRLLETRMLARRIDGKYALATYRWNTAQTDADVVLGDWQTDMATKTPWTYFGPAGCAMCHSSAKGADLGLRSAQLAISLPDPATKMPENQLVIWKNIGLLDATSIPAIDTAADTTVFSRARRYLDVNCASCHSAGARYYMGFDFSESIPLTQMGVCNKAPAHGTLGVATSKLLVPGSPATSVISLRMHAVNASRMPRFGSEVVDVEGTAAVDAWIAQLLSCTDAP